jgi:hypothetical protein
MGQSRMDNLKTQATLDTRHMQHWTQDTGNIGHKTQATLDTRHRQHWTQDTERRQQSKSTTIEN